jgi:hypothetical protein
MARNRFWLAVAPTRYAVRKKRRERKGVDRREMARANCSETTAKVKYFVNGSCPQSLVT